MPVTRLRRIFQLVVLAAALHAGWSFARGLGLASVETYCPFGGLETAWSVLTGGRVSCATGSHNLTLMAALLVLALLARKAFCGWVCPVGTVSELLAAAARRLRPGRRAQGLVTPPRAADRWLRWLRWPVLVLILVLTARTAELVFRPLCPYYVMTSFHGHEVQAWSYGVLAVLLAGALVVPMIWCRYLCPLGAALWPPAAAGILRLRRRPERCSGCRACDAACPHSLSVSEAAELRSGECTLCLACVDSCPSAGALELAAPRLARPLPRPLVPALVVVLAASGVVAGDAVALPSYVLEVAAAEGETATATLVVRQVRCVDTARTAASHLATAAGVLRITAYAARHELEVEYDPSLTDAGTLARALEGPVWDGETGQFLYGRYEVLGIEEGGRR
ncbi:MAG: 4Fe-4S binding protein [Deltaproteobacteria bacterium]|nr:4Fe-4S binding protein [Deltaproteobacteria bacterium]